LVVSADGHHDRMTFGDPDGEHPVVAIQMAGTNVVQRGACQSITGRLATAIPQLSQGRCCRLAATPPEITNLTLCGRRQ
jgi:hypothetical protein